MSTLRADKLQSVDGVIYGTAIQTVSTSTTATISSTSAGSTVASGFILSITPQYANSVIIISIIGGCVNYGSTAASHQLYMYRQIGAGGYSNIGMYENDYQGNTWGLNQSYLVMDTPNTTSTVSYQPYFWFNTSNRGDLNSASTLLTMTAQEIQR